jgi:putative protease
LTIAGEGFSVNGVDGNLIRVNKTLSGSRYTDISLYRNFDTTFVKNLHSERRIPVDIIFKETRDGFCIKIGEKERCFNYPHEPAKNEAKALETIRTQLTKLGDTPYIARGVTIESRPYFIPISILNEWRRNTII